jgi:hypothetical protein
MPADVLVYAVCFYNRPDLALHRKRPANRAIFPAIQQFGSDDMTHDHINPRVRELESGRAVSGLITKLHL